MALAHLRAFGVDETVTAPPRERRIAINGADLAYYEWNGENGGPDVLLAHATGFHARCWDGVVRALGENCGRVVALDMRGHGRSSNTPPYHWRQFGEDLAAFVDALDLRGALAVGHSMGGHCVVQAAAAHPARLGRLLLVDPVILAPEAYRDAPAFGSPEEHPVSRRRNRWLSAEAMIERFKGRHPFSLWNPQVLEDYCRYGLVPAEDGDGMVLGCPPLVEASIYLGSAGRDIGALVPTLRNRVVVLRAKRKPKRDSDMDFSQSPTWEGLASAFRNGEDVYLPELTHFIPMQRPDLVAEHIQSLR